MSFHPVSEVGRWPTCGEGDRRARPTGQTDQRPCSNRKSWPANAKIALDCLRLGRAPNQNFQNVGAAELGKRGSVKVGLWKRGEHNRGKRGGLGPTRRQKPLGKESEAPRRLPRDGREVFKSMESGSLAWKHSCAKRRKPESEKVGPGCFRGFTDYRQVRRAGRAPGAKRKDVLEREGWDQMQPCWKLSGVNATDGRATTRKKRQVEAFAS